MKDRLSGFVSSNYAMTAVMAVVMIGLLALTVGNLQQRQNTRTNAQVAISQTPSQGVLYPTFGALGPCPSCETPSVPVVSGYTGGPTSGANAPTSAYTSQAPQAPCDAESSSLAGDKKKKKKSKHKKHEGGISKAMEALFKFLIELINLLIKLFGGTPIQQPQTPAPGPTDSPEVEVPEAPEDPEPSEAPDGDENDPCEPSAQPSGGQQMPSAYPSQSAGMPSNTPSGAMPSYAVPSSGAPLPSGSQSTAIDLTNWKLTLPTGSTGKPTEILQPQLASFTQDPWYVKNSDGSLKFRSAVNGVTTSGSDYPRSELREMNGSSLAAWSNSSGTHTMTIEQAITAQPKTKKHVVAGQIHDGSDDVIVIRLEDKKLFVDIGGTEGPTLDTAYTLGKKFIVKFEATGGKTNIYYNGATTPAHTLSKAYSGAYFKAGAYTQSNCTTDPGDCSANNYGEVVIYKLQVTHN